MINLANVIGIMGESGSGKTTSFRNLDPKTTFYIDCDKKGLSWKNWKKSYSGETKNYISTDQHQIVMTCLKKINEDKQYKNISVIVIDTINGLMVADEMRRMQEKNYDKWQDMAQSIYYLFDYALTMRDDVTVIFTAHTQTDHDDNGYLFTKIKTSGRKLDKICLESKLTTVLWAEKMEDGYFFHTKGAHSTCKTPFGAFEQDLIPNDITEVLKALEEF